MDEKNPFRFYEKTQTKLTMPKPIAFVLHWVSTIIGFVLAPLLAAVKAIAHQTNWFANRILNDLYPPQVMVTGIPGEGQNMTMPKSKCCSAMIQAKIEHGQIQYFYCSQCKNEIDKEEFNPNPKA